MVSKLRVVQTIASTRLDHGGTSRSVPALCEALVSIGVDNHLITARPANAAIACGFPSEKDRVHLALESPHLRQFGVGKQFCQMLNNLRAGSEKLVVHDHAVWMPTNHAVASFCRRHRVRRIVSPRGMLGSWAMSHGKYKKKIAWLLYQLRDLQSADGFHATSEQEADEIRALGFKQPIAVVANGLTLPTSLPKKQAGSTRQTALFLSRIHPKKGLLTLIEAWKNANLGTNWQLLIAGPDEGGHAADVEVVIKRLGLEGQVKLVGPVDDNAKWQCYVDADLFILPSFNENFGSVIAEAMAAGLPVITTTGTPWECLRSDSMGWWVEPSVDSISAVLREASRVGSISRIAMGLRGQSYVTSRFSWTSVADRLTHFYQCVYDGTLDQRIILNME